MLNEKKVQIELEYISRIRNLNKDQFLIKDGGTVFKVVPKEVYDIRGDHHWIVDLSIPAYRNVNEIQFERIPYKPLFKKYRVIEDE